MQQLLLSWGLYVSRGRLLHGHCRLVVTSQVLELAMMSLGVMSFDVMSFDVMSLGCDVIGSTKCIAANLLIVGIAFFILGL